MNVPPAIPTETHRGGQLAGSAGRKDALPALYYLITRTPLGEYRVPLQFIPVEEING